jgi:hypothetical protein
MYLTYGPELTALVGKAAYDKLAELCAAGEKSGLIAIHPATAAAAQPSPGAAATGLAEA